jgi:NhaP-type Na+/H+ or K+/H+ antiporter
MFRKHLHKILILACPLLIFTTVVVALVLYYLMGFDKQMDLI